MCRNCGAVRNCGGGGATYRQGLWFGEMESGVPRNLWLAPIDEGGAADAYNEVKITAGLPQTSETETEIRVRVRV